MTRFNHFTTWLLASLPLFLLLLFQIPITLYHNNIYELPFSLSAIWMLKSCG